MEQYPYTIDELRESVELGTQQVESGNYYTNAQVDWWDTRRCPQTLTGK